MDPNLKNADAPAPRARLGRGLAALLGAPLDGNAPSAPREGLRRVPLEFLQPNPKNPRKHFDESELEGLAESIRERGVLQPVLVRAVPNRPNAYEIVAGERRWRAAQRAAQSDIPVLVLEVEEKEALELSIIENVQRTDLNALEEAAGYAQLGSEYGYSHADIARVVGKSRSHVANTLRLTALPDHARQLLVEGRISAGHARALLPLDDPDRVADQIVANGLTVRDVEQLSQSPNRTSRPRAPRAPADPDTVALCEKLRLSLGVAVTIRRSGETGELRIPFHDLDQLDEFCRRLEGRGRN
jgi:ParB family transcriptional regulator, chromosome partitioning protein